MALNLSDEQKIDDQDVAAIVTSMTDDEKPFLFETMEAVLSDPGIGQAILCVEEKNTSLNSLLGPLLKDPRLEIIRIPMMPIGAVRNRALNHVRKPWVAYCDGDDVWCKGKTMIQRAYATKTGANFVGAGHYLTDEAGRIWLYGLSRYIPMPSTWLVRTEILKSYPFNDTLYQGSDGEWWIITYKAVPKVKCPKMLLRYRVRASSVSSATHPKKQKVKLVNIARIPVLGLSIRFFSYCLWVLTRHKPYAWQDVWTEWLKRYEKR